jgi:FAD/FMN-containing dehydrogenase
MKSRSGAAAELVLDRLSQAVGPAHATILDGGRLSVRPGSAAEIVDVIRIAAEIGVSVGVGVTSGVALDLGRMCNVLHLDETSLLVSVQAGMTFEALESVLTERGLTLGPLPPTSRTRTIGALLAAPRPSEASPATGRFTQQVSGVVALLADGTEVATRVAPRKATGPDLLHALVGARGTLGLVTAATLRMARRGEAHEEASFQFSTVEDALRAARELLVAGGRPVDLAVTVPARLSVTVEGAPPHAAAERELAERVSLAHGGEAVPFRKPAPIASMPHERAVPLERIEAAVPSREGCVIGWHRLGAAVVDPTRAPERPAAHSITVGLKRRLDPDHRFPDWPGA